MKKIILITLVSLLLACSAGNGIRKEIPQKQPPQSQSNEKVRQLEEKRSDPNLYFGEGIATIENDDIGSARELAKTRALDDISSAIKVNVQSDIRQTIQSSIEGSVEKIRSSFEQKVQTYTNIALTNVREHYVLDYPRTGNLTFYVYVTKAEYQQKVNDDLRMKKTAVQAVVQSGDAALKRNDFMVAARHWIDALDKLDNFFGSLPLQVDLDGNGDREEAHAYINKQIAALFGNIELECIEGTFTYDATGKLSQKPIVQAKYRGRSGQQVAVANLPLQVEFVNGSGSIDPNLQTSNYGECELNVKVDASHPQTNIAVRINKAGISGLNAFQLPNLGETRITMDKIKTVAVVVLFQNQAEQSRPDNLVSEVNSLLLGKQCLAVDMRINGAQVTQADLSRAAQQNADYLLAVIFKSTGAGTVGGYSNMYAANVSGTIALYKLPRGDQMAMDRVSSAKGFGVSASVAGWDAFGKVQQNALNKTRQMIEASL